VSIGSSSATGIGSSSAGTGATGDGAGCDTDLGNFNLYFFSSSKLVVRLFFLNL
jgi:hypothetical protein